MLASVDSSGVRQPGTRQGAGKRPPHRCRFTLEALEDRWLPSSYSFVKIADATGPLSGFVQYGATIGNDGTVAFQAYSDAGEEAQGGIFTGSGGNLTPIALLGAEVSEFIGLDSVPSINDSGTVAFWGQSLTAGIGIFTGNGGPLTIIDNGGSFPGVPYASPDINDAGQVAYLRGLSLNPNNLGIFASDGVTTTAIAIDGGLEGDEDPFAGLIQTHPAINNGGEVAFSTLLEDAPAPGQGILRGSGGALTTIAQTGAVFTGLSNFTAINDFGLVAFHAYVPEGEGIFLGDGASMTTVVDSSGPFKLFANMVSVNNAGTVAFSSFITQSGLGVEGVFVGPDPVADKVLAPGDTLFGLQVGVVGLSPRALNDQGQLALMVDLYDDAFNYVMSAIVRADPIIEQDDCWESRTPMPTTRSSLDVGVVNDVLYAVGGVQGSFPGLTTVEAYDPATDTWSAKAPMPTGRNGPAVGVVEGVLYAVGGADHAVAGTPLATVEAYDPLTNTWTTRAPMLTARAHLDVAAVGGILYAFGGATASGPTAVVEAYDPVTDTWTTKAPMPTARASLGVEVVNGIIYAVGGQVGEGTFTDVVEAYDPATDTWTTVASMLSPRGAHATGVAGGLLYAAGGNTADDTAVTTVEAYNPATDTWTSQAAMPTGRFLLAGGVIDNVFYAVGGATGSGVTGIVEAYVCANHVPAVDAGPDQSLIEGDLFTQAGVFTDPDADTWAATVDFGDGAGVQPLTLNDDGTFFLEHVYLDNGVYTITVTVADGRGGIGVDTVQVTVANADPVIESLVSSSMEPGGATPGSVVAIEALFTDGGILDLHSAVVDWGDGSDPENLVIEDQGGFGWVSGEHVYGAGGWYTVTLIVADEDGGQASGTTPVAVTGVGLQNGVLNIVGSDLADFVQVSKVGKALRVRTNLIPDVQSFAIGAVQRIVASLGAGNDAVDLGANVPRPAVLDGGADDDWLQGGRRANILLGGDGNDRLIGGADRDLLIGGVGADRLLGQGGEDILIAGLTEHDQDFVLLDAIMAEWTRTDRSYNQRLLALQNGGGNNGSALLNAETAFSDDERDKLWGGSQKDWFLIDLTHPLLQSRDRAQDLASREEVLAILLREDD